MQYLVEEHMQDIDGNIVIPFRQIVEADSARDAFEKVQTEHRDHWWYFSPRELWPAVDEYLWDAADGSMVKYEVRQLPTPKD